MKKEKGKKKKKIIIYIALLLIILYVFYTVFLLTVQSTKLFTVEQGKIYLEETLNGYIIRDETVVKGENYKNGMEQIKTEGEKTAKNESVFRYYSQNETDLKQKISELDEKIQTALKESENLITSDGLSAEVKTIENKIDEKTKEISKLTDMSKIAEYKKEINELVSKKAKIAGDSSKQGSYLKQLIEQRAKYETEEAAMKAVCERNDAVLKYLENFAKDAGCVFNRLGNGIVVDHYVQNYPQAA